MIYYRFLKNEKEKKKKGDFTEGDEFDQSIHGMFRDTPIAPAWNAQLRAERGNGDDITLCLFQGGYRDAKGCFLKRQQGETVPCIGIGIMGRVIPDEVEDSADVDLKGVPPRIRILLVKTFDKKKWKLHR